MMDDEADLKQEDGSLFNINTAIRGTSQFRCYYCNKWFAMHDVIGRFECKKVHVGAVDRNMMTGSSTWTCCNAPTDSSDGCVSLEHSPCYIRTPSLNFMEFWCLPDTDKTHDAFVRLRLGTKEEISANVANSRYYRLVDEDGLAEIQLNNRAAAYCPIIQGDDAEDEQTKTRALAVSRNALQLLFASDGTTDSSHTATYLYCVPRFSIVELQRAAQRHRKKTSQTM